MSLEITQFLDSDGKIKIWPSKLDKKKEILIYLATKFENDRVYTEKQVNAIIIDWHTFGDYFMLRRGLVDYGFILRTTNGSKYWKSEK